MTDHTKAAHAALNGYNYPVLSAMGAGNVEKAQVHALLAIADAIRRSLTPKPVNVAASASRCWATEVVSDGRVAHWKRCAWPHPHDGGHHYVDVAPPSATGSPQGDEQPEPGQVDGGEATEAAGGDFPCCTPNHFENANIANLVRERNAAVARAEKAEERARQAVAGRLEVADERDRCRSDLADIASRLRKARAYGVPIMWTGAMRKLIDRYAPEG